MTNQTLIETEDDYARAQLRVLELGRPEEGSPEEQEQLSLGEAMLRWELANAGAATS